MKRIRTIRIIPGIISLPIISIAYILNVLNYIEIWRPGIWAIAPLPVTIILGWIMFVVVDTLYQFYMISKIPD
jgi:hypothetical protein